MDSTRSLQKWGNSSGVRIPKEFIKRAKLSVNQPLKITMRGDSIVLTPIKAEPTITLEAMLKGVTPEKVGGEFDWGGEVGAEQYE